MPKLLDAAYVVLAAATAPWWMRKTRGGWAERFGRTASIPRGAKPRLLIHAVSVGEVNLTRPLVERLLPEVDVVVASTTDTGIKRARDLFGSRCPVVRYPLDASWSVRRFLDAVRPDAVALVELEVWPQFVSECDKRGIPAAVINGRLSDRSFPRYYAARGLISGVFKKLAFAAAQDSTYAERFVALGVPRDRVYEAGTMKWDSAEVSSSVAGADELAAEMGIDRTRPLVVAGSTAPGEDALLHDALPRSVQLLCAPRKTEHFDRAAADMPGCVRRSTRQVAPPGTGRYLLDTIGELRKAYALADVVVIGRSFGKLYGSDPMEAAALGKPVIIGPNTANFRTIVQAMKYDGAILVAPPEELVGVLRHLLEHPEERRAMGERARMCVLRHKGSTERHAELLLDVLNRRAGTDQARPRAAEVSI